MAFDRARLEAFMDLSEGEAPPVFVGRTTVLEDILSTAESVWAGADTASHGKPKITRIIQGAPGAGKSAVLAELARQAQHRTTNGVRTQVLKLGAGIIDGPIDILGPLAALINEKAATDFLAQFQKTRSVGGSVGALATAVTGERSTTTIPLAPAPNLAAFCDWVQALNGEGALKGPIIVAIDEAQRFQRTPDDPVAKVLQTIHDADLPLPLTLVLAGLGDTNDRAMDMGLTRGRTLHTIGALCTDEVADLMTGFCRHHGLDPTIRGGPFKALATPCEGWPRHLHFALQALGREVLAAEGVLADVDWVRASAVAAVSRLHYYQGQQSGAMTVSAALVGAVLDDLKPFQRRSHVINSINRHARAHPDDREWQIPKDMDADMLTDHLVHCGALQEEPDGTLNCPIPSFRSYLVHDWVRMEGRDMDWATMGAAPTARQAARIIEAAEPHTEEEIIRWEALRATWCRHWETLTAIRAEVADLATVGNDPTDTDRTRAASVIAVLAASGARSPSGTTAPALPRSLPYAERATEALSSQIDAIRTAAQRVLDGAGGGWCQETLGIDIKHIETALTASPEDQLKWALGYLGIETPPPGPSMDC